MPGTWLSREISRRLSSERLGLLNLHGREKRCLPLLFVFLTGSCCSNRRGIGSRRTPRKRMVLRETLLSGFTLCLDFASSRRVQNSCSKRVRPLDLETGDDILIVSQPRGGVWRKRTQLLCFRVSQHENHEHDDTILTNSATERRPLPTTVPTSNASTFQTK